MLDSAACVCPEISRWTGPRQDLNREYWRHSALLCSLSLAQDLGAKGASLLRGWRWVSVPGPVLVPHAAQSSRGLSWFPRWPCTERQMCALLQLHKHQVKASVSSAWEVSSIWRGGDSFSFQEPVGKGRGGEEKGDKGGQDGASVGEEAP